MGKIIRQITPQRQPITRVVVSGIKINVNGTIEIDKQKTSQPCRALIDTGATHSVVSKRIIDNLKLQSIGKTKVNTPSHDNHEVNNYHVIIGVSLDEKMQMDKDGPYISANMLSIPLIVSGSDFIEKQEIDVILGMDVIMAGHLSISAGMFIFSI